MKQINWSVVAQNRERVDIQARILSLEQQLALSHSQRVLITQENNIVLSEQQQSIERLSDDNSILKVKMAKVVSASETRVSEFESVIAQLRWLLSECKLTTTIV